uniref:Putative transmembrane protein n=1 Tax=Toxoplasma gondii COUG TaxID=1074873 RepID=A0A2G8Y7C2_TOXGO|nr:putative transmembrane protein [Toxoplasma gondii COUG]
MATQLSDPYAAHYAPVSSAANEPTRPAVLVSNGPPTGPSVVMPSAGAPMPSSYVACPASAAPSTVYVMAQGLPSTGLAPSTTGSFSYPAQSAMPGGSFFMSSAPISTVRQAQPPTLLPALPHSFRAGWLGSRLADASSEDLPGVRTLRGGIVTCIMVLLVSSLFACLGRTDFNFVLYLVGYHLWCVDGETKSVTGVKRLLRGARQYAVLLCIASIVEITWLFIAYSTWSCEKGDAELCFPESENLRVRWTYGMHNWALGLSTFNLLVKIFLIFLSFTWVQQQRTTLGLGGAGPVPGGTSILPPGSD